jgi:signal transduction histidine kinase
MEVAYIDLQTASEQHAWGTNIITIDIASDVIYQRLKNNEIDNETIETAEELLLSSQRGYKRIMDIYNAFSQGRTLGSPLLKPTWRIEPVPIYSVLNNLVQELQPDFHENNIDVKITSSAELVDVNGVSPMLQIAFREMLCNSIEAIQKNKEDNADRLITIIMSSDPKKDLIIEIQDTGIGIPFEDRGKIFNTDYSSKRKTGGLGLKLAKMVFDQHNGSIELKTVNGMGETDMNGCTFIINLPCRKGCKS